MILRGENQVDKQHNDEGEDDPGEENLYGQRSDEGRPVLQVRIAGKAVAR